MFTFYACIIYAYYSNFEQLNQLDLNFSPTTFNFSEILKLSKPMYLSVNYIELIPILIQSIQSLQNEIELLKDSNNKTPKRVPKSSSNQKEISSSSIKKIGVF